MKIFLMVLILSSTAITAVMAQEDTNTCGSVWTFYEVVGKDNQHQTLIAPSGGYLGEVAVLRSLSWETGNIHLAKNLNDSTQIVVYGQINYEKKVVSIDKASEKKFWKDVKENKPKTWDELKDKALTLCRKEG